MSASDPHISVLRARASFSAASGPVAKKPSKRSYPPFSMRLSAEERTVDAQSKTVVQAYEKRIQEMEESRIEISEKVLKIGHPVKDFSEVYRTACLFLSNPHKLWASGQFVGRKAVMKLAFSERPTYDRNKGYRTAKTTLPFKLLERIGGGNGEMVGLDGLEPSTNGLKVHCSTN